MSSDVTLTDNFQFQSEFVDTDNITLWDQKKDVQITANITQSDQKKDVQITDTE
jgi:hypothetical protein